MKITQYTRFDDGSLRAIPLCCRPDTQQQELQLLNLYPDICFQQIGVFGGAITDAVGAVLEQLPYETAKKLISGYFGPDGIGYRAIRTHIDSCDFSTAPYSAQGEFSGESLEAFSLAHDKKRIIPWIKLAYELAGDKLPVMLTPWSPPAYMKTNQSRTGGGHLKPEYYGLWASYICLYIKAYIEEGILVDSISVQNEPNAVQIWDSCLFSPQEEKSFLLEALYPCMKKEGLEHIRIYVWDHNKERLYDRACQLIDEQTDNMIAGLAFHWYSGDHFEALDLVRHRFPDKLLTFSEGCIEYSRHDKDHLRNAQIYAHDMLGNFRCGMNNFYDWNICLDEKGGPNYAGNFCDAPVMCDVETGLIQQRLSYGYISQFSSFIKEGARRIGSSVYTDALETVAFVNPDGEIIAIILNRNPEEYKLTLRLGSYIADLSVPANSLSTVSIKNI